MSEYWKDKHVVILGGGNLIGTHLARILNDIADVVYVVDNFSSGKLENIPNGVIFSNIDCRNYEDVERQLRPGDIVFHLAAQHGGRGYVATHDVELYNNLELDTTIFRACADVGVEKVIFSSSACAYPIAYQQDPDVTAYLHEDLIYYKNLLTADGPYGTEKLVGEAMLDAYIEQGAFKGCSTRSFTVYGPLMNESHAIAALIAKTMIRQDPFEIWGVDGNQYRNWTFVEDNVQGALLAAEHLNRGAVNIGVEDRLTPNMACEIIWDIMGWRPDEITYKKDAPVGPVNRIADATKLKSLGWEPKYSFRQGLEKTIEWYLSTHDVEEVKKTLERKLTER